MRVFEWLLAGLAGWTAIGIAGTVLALATRDRRRALRGVLWIAGVWAVYLAAVMLTGRLQAQRVLSPGQEECFDRVCYAVEGSSAIEEFKGTGGGELIEVRLRITNRADEPRGVTGIEAYLTDSSGSRWASTPGLGGVPPGIRLPVGGQTGSRPVFRVQGNPPDLSLVLTRGWKGWGWLVIGNTDSLLHKPALLRLRQASGERGVAEKE